MSRIFMQDIQGPLVLGAGTVRGAAGRRKRSFSCPAGPELCRISPDRSEERRVGKECSEPC